MKRILFVAALLSIPALLFLGRPAAADTHTISWPAVTQYADGTPLDNGVSVTYSVYWTTDPALGAVSLRTIASSLSGLSATFDPAVLGMPAGSTVYFTAKATISTGTESALTPAAPWVVPGTAAAPPPAPPPPVLSSLAIGGPSSVNEGTTATYAATATWSDGTTTAVAPSWGVTSPYATISAAGLLAAGAVPSSQPATVTASYTSGGVTKSASLSVTIADVPATLVSVSIGGLSSVNEGSTATYTATATWSDNTTSTVSPAWSVTTSYATISAGGVLTAARVTTSQTVAVSASYTSGGVTRSASRNVTIAKLPPSLTGLTIAGPASVNETDNAVYSATATWSDNTTSAVSAQWSVTTSYATITAGGVLVAGSVSRNQTVTVTGFFTSGGVTVTATKSVTILDVPKPGSPGKLKFSAAPGAAPVAPGA